MEMNGGGSRFVPDDVLIDILVLLPVKSLCRLKCICKKWYDFIQNPNFIKSYITRSKYRNGLLAVNFPSRWSRDITFSLFLDDDLSSSQRLNNPLFSCHEDVRQILGPVNGLYFIHYDRGTDDDDACIAFWNPNTSEFRKLDRPSGLLEIFGFGSTDDDIKLVCISSLLKEDKYLVVVLLYSLVHDCWKEIDLDSELANKFTCLIRASLYLNRSYYWLVGYHQYHLIVFDMRTEVFREIPLPDEEELIDEMNNWRYSLFDRILVRNKSIVLVVAQSLTEGFFLSQATNWVDIWELEDEEGHWNLLSSFEPSFSYTPPLRFWKDDEIIFRTNDAKLFLYDIHSQGIRNLGIEASFCVLDYEETLTSAKGGRSIDFTPKLVSNQI